MQRRHLLAQAIIHLSHAVNTGNGVCCLLGSFLQLLQTLTELPLQLQEYEWKTAEEMIALVKDPPSETE